MIPALTTRLHRVCGHLIEIVRTEDHGTITLRAPHMALDLTLRPDTMKRAGWHTVIDDDPQGTGVQTRLHVYGKERLLELKALIDQAVEEIETGKGSNGSLG